MSTPIRYLIIIVVAAGATAAAFFYYQSWTAKRTVFVNTASVRNVVTGLGDELQSVSLLAPAADVKAAMDTHYALYVNPDLLAKWEANPQSAPGRLTSSPWPDRIDVTDTTKNDDGTYTITANIIEIANGINGRETVNTIPVKFTVAQGPDGWQISGYEKL